MNQWKKTPRHVASVSGAPAPQAPAGLRAVRSMPTQGRSIRQRGSILSMPVTRSCLFVLLIPFLILGAIVMAQSVGWKAPLFLAVLTTAVVTLVIIFIEHPWSSSGRRDSVTPPGGLTPTQQAAWIQGGGRCALCGSDQDVTLRAIRSGNVGAHQAEDIRLICARCLEKREAG